MREFKVLFFGSFGMLDGDHRNSGTANDTIGYHTVSMTSQTHRHSTIRRTSVHLFVRMCLHTVEMPNAHTDMKRFLLHDPINDRSVRNDRSR